MTTVAGSILLRMRSLSLQSRFMLTFGSVVVTLILVVIFFASHRQSRTAMDQIEKRAMVIAQSLSTVSTPALLTYDYSTLQRLADEIRAETGAVYVIIHDKESAIGGFSGRPDLQWSHLEDIEAAHALTNENPHVHVHSGLPTGMPQGIGGNILEVTLPVRTDDSNTRWGTVRVGLSLAEVRAEVSRTTRDLAFVGLFAVAVVLVSARYFTSRITAPLRELAEATSRVADGHLDQTVDEDLVGELGEAARSLSMGK